VADNESLTPIERAYPQRVGGLTPTTLEWEAQGAEVHFTLSTFWPVVVKRAGMIAAVTLIVSALTTIVTFRMAPIYKATTTIEVESDYPQLQSLNWISTCGSRPMLLGLWCVWPLPYTPVLGRGDVRKMVRAASPERIGEFVV